MPLVNCIFNDGLDNAMPNMQQMLLQFINVVHPRLIDLLLDDTPYLVGLWLTGLSSGLFVSHRSGGMKAALPARQAVQ